MRKIAFAPGEYYHIVNRGISKKNIFLTNADYVRFIFLILYCQSPTVITETSNAVKDFLTTGQFNIKEAILDKITTNRYVELVAFSLMPNHYHLLIKEKEDNGISRYLQRIQNAYAKYFNIKNEISGHLFQGPFRAVHIEDNEQLLHLSAYIHKNCCKLPSWAKNPERYKWSSFYDYVNDNRWGELLNQDILLNQFKNKEEYYFWVKDNSSKDLSTD